MRTLRRCSALAVLAAVLCLSLAPSAGAADQALANRLVHKFVDQIKAHDVAGLRKFLSPAFQIQRADGSHATKAQYLRNLPTIRSYRVRRVTATRSGNVLVATYQIDSNQIVDGKPYKTGFAPRISTFVHSRAGWQIVEHANFNRPK